MTKRVLAIALSVVMMLSLIPMSSAANSRATGTVEEYIAPANLGKVAETLLADLGDRATEFAPALLAILFDTVPVLEEQAKADGIDKPYRVSTETLAASLIKLIDSALEDLDLNSSIGSYSGLIGALGVDVKDLNSVNGFYTTLYTALANTINSKATWGDLASLKEDSLARGSGRNKAAMQTTDKVDTPCYDMLNGLFGFLSDNASVIGKIVREGINLGSINGVINTFLKVNAEDLVNGYVNNIPAIIKGLIYDNLLAADDGAAYEDSAYKAYTVDELLASVLINLVNDADKGTVVDRKVASAATEMTLYELIGEYADTAIANYALIPLNTSLKDAINGLIAGDAELKKTVEKIIDMNYEFTENTLDFSGYVKNGGVFENLNNIIVTILQTVLTDEAEKAIGFESGDNTKLTPNLEKACRYALTVLAGYNGGDIGGYDFSKYTADAVAKLSLEDMAVSVLDLFMNDWFGKTAPESADTLEELAAWAGYNAIDKYYIAKYPQYKPTLEAKKGLVFAENGVDTLDGKSQEYWYDTIADIGMDLVEFVLNYISTGDTDYGVKDYNYAENPADWVDKADNVVDWALAYVDGFPAITDMLKANGSDAVYPEADEYVEYGPFYKLNVIINDLFPLSFITGASDGYFALDVEKLIFEVIAPSITDFTLDKFAGAFAQNDAEDNPFNDSFISSTVGFIDNLLFSLLECDQPDGGENFTKEATCWSKGYTGKANSGDKYYISISATTDRLPIPEETEPVKEINYGDVNGDGKVLANDARTALRASASLETLEGDAALAADVNQDGKILADDARQILRYSAQLITEFTVKQA